MHCKADIKNCLMDSLKVLVKCFSTHLLAKAFSKLTGDELNPNSPTLQIVFELEICAALDIMKGKSLLAEGEESNGMLIQLKVQIIFLTARVYGELLVTKKTKQKRKRKRKQ